jgi:hypothetical protein
VGSHILPLAKSQHPQRHRRRVSVAAEQFPDGIPDDPPRYHDDQDRLITMCLVGRLAGDWTATMAMIAATRSMPEGFSRQAYRRCL